MFVTFNTLDDDVVVRLDDILYARAELVGGQLCTRIVVSHALGSFVTVMRPERVARMLNAAATMPGVSTA